MLLLSHVFVAFYDYTSLPKDFEDLKEQQQQK